MGWILAFIIMGIILIGNAIEKHQKAEYYRNKYKFDYDGINKIIEKNRRQ